VGGQEKRGDTTQHLQANPTAGEYYRKKEREEAERKREERERQLLEKYGGGDQKAMPAALRSMAITESERFVEYDESGLIKGAPRRQAKSKYAEDVLVNNHKSVWGSWWSNFTWGYACCHSFVKNSYCTGEEGKQAWEAAERQRTGANLIEDAPEDAEEHADGETADHKEADHKESDDAASKKRSREQMLNGVSEEELEEYRRKRTAANDPMAKFLGKDELVS